MRNVWISYDYDISSSKYILSVSKNIGGRLVEDEVTYNPLPGRHDDIVIDVSSSIGLFQSKQKDLSDLENERLERCLADLLMCYMHLEMVEIGTNFLIEGPPLPKVIGRIGYRYPRPDLTILFVTTEKCFLSPPENLNNSELNWDGPIPNFQEDSISRTFYGKDLNNKLLRVDLFSQGLNRYGVDEKKDGLPYGVLAKLNSVTESISAFADWLDKKRQPANEAIMHDKGQASFPMEDNFQSEVRRKAAKVLKNRPWFKPEHTSTDIGVSRSVAQDLSDNEIFKACSDGKMTAVEQARFETLKSFLEKEHLGIVAQQVEFIRFVQLQLTEKKHSKKYVYTHKDLDMWYGKYTEEKYSHSTEK